MTIQQQFTDKVERVNQLVMIRYRMVQEDTQESLIAADLLTEMIEQEGREATTIARCYPSVD